MQLPMFELSEWITTCKSAGATEDVLIAQLMTSGWPEALAIHVIGGEPVSPMKIEEPPTPVRSEMPDVALQQSPTSIVAEGHVVRILTSMRFPRVVIFGGLLSNTECDELIRLAKPRLSRSTVVDKHTGNHEMHVARTSDGMFFAPNEHPLLQTIDRRIAALINWPVERGEGLQVLRYGPGTQYKPHYDYFPPHEAGAAIMLKRGGQRVGSLVMYLNTPEGGGGTIFPEIGFEVAPQRGNAVFFSYDRPHPCTKTLHGGAPVIVGEKWVATKWLRERDFVV